MLYIFFLKYYTIELSRIQREVVIDKWWNIFGIPPYFVDETYLNSIMETHPYTSYDNTTNKVALVMNSWRVPHEREQK